MLTSPSTGPTWIPASGRSRSGPRSTRPSPRCARCMTRRTSASRCESPLPPPGCACQPRGRSRAPRRYGLPAPAGAARMGAVPSPVVTDGAWVIRRTTPEDRAFMGDMLVAAVNWSPEWKKKSRERVLSTPRTAHYIAGWPRDTDLGVIAEGNGQRVGAAWLRFLPASDPGYGFVASDVPELTVGVAPSWRGRGAGRALLRAIADQAR